MKEGYKMKFTLFIVVIILIVIFRKKIALFFVRNLKLNEVLISYYGGECDLWSPLEYPEEYIFGHKIRWGRRFKRIEFVTGRNGLTAPMQAYGTLNFFDKHFETKADGAQILSTRKDPPDRNGQTRIVWSFDKSPYKYGITDYSKETIAEQLQETFNYYLVDKWPLKVARCQNAADVTKVRAINADIRHRGWLSDPKKTTRRYDVQD